MDINLEGMGGVKLNLPEADWENLVHLLERGGVDLVKLVEEKTLDAEDARRVGEMLGEMKLEAVETRHGQRIRPIGGQDTDPIIAVMARLADMVGDAESAEAARKMLLEEAATLVVRPLNDAEIEKISGWSRFLIESGGVRLSS